MLYASSISWCMTRGFGFASPSSPNDRSVSIYSPIANNILCLEPFRSETMYLRGFRKQYNLFRSLHTRRKRGLRYGYLQVLNSARQHLPHAINDHVDHECQ